jgi:hypothetical protein
MLKLLALLLALASPLALADVDIASDDEALRTAAGNPPGVRANLIVRTDVQLGNESYEWNLVARLYNQSDRGQNTAFTAQAYKHGAGSTWGVVVEAHDYTGQGFLIGQEIDLLANGPANNSRLGLTILVGKSDPALPAPVVDAGITIAPFNFQSSQQDTTAGSVRYGLDIRTHCQAACIRVGSGERIALSDDPVVGALSFDPLTGFAGFIRANRFCVWCVQQATGEVWTMRQLP